MVLAETPTFRTKSDKQPINATIGIVIGSVALVASLISILIYTILNQKHEQEDLLEEGYDQETRLATERNMTAYFAHELRNRKSYSKERLRTWYSYL